MSLRPSLTRRARIWYHMHAKQGEWLSLFVERQRFTETSRKHSMRTAIGIAAVMMAAHTLAAECRDGICPLPATDEALYTVLSPVPESAVEPIKPAPRL